MQVSTSFVQDERHGTKTERFLAIQPSQIAEVLADHGFDLVQLRTGNARNEDRKHHQTTVARYRHREALEVKGHSLDLVVRAPHLYGALTVQLGLFRMVCTNQWVAGTWGAFDNQLAAASGGRSEFQRERLVLERVRHNTKGIELLNAAIPRIVSHRDQLSHHVRMLQARDVTPREVADLALSAARERLRDVEHVTNFDANDLLRVRRDDDRAATLWNAANIIQENLMRHGMAYRTEHTVRENGREQHRVRNLTTRTVHDASERAIGLNVSVWDAASALLAA